jgi:ankyrin repeat protein
MDFNDMTNLIWNKKNDEFYSLINKDLKKYTKLEDTNKRTLLSYAAMYGNLEVLDFLVKNKFDINHKDSSGYTPLFLAIQDKHLDSIEYLFDSGANVELIPDYTAYGILGSLSFNLNTDSADLLKKMIDDDVKLVNADLNMILRGNNIDAYKYILKNRKLTSTEIINSLVDLSGTTKEKIDFLEYLLDNNFIDINEKAYGSETLLSIILEKSNDYKIPKFLIDKGADLSFRDTGTNCLLKMSEKENLDIVKLFIENSVNINSLNQYKQNALHFEAKRYSYGKEPELPKTFEYLISQGIELTIKDAYGKTPIDYLIEKKRTLSIKHIFEKIVNEVISKIGTQPDEDLFKVLLSIQEYPSKKEKDLLIDTFAKFPKLLSKFEDQLYEDKLKLREIAIIVLINVDDDKSIEALKGRAQTESNKGLLKLLNKYLENK